MIGDPKYRVTNQLSRAMERHLASTFRLQRIRARHVRGINGRREANRKTAIDDGSSPPASEFQMATGVPRAHQHLAC